MITALDEVPVTTMEGLLTEMRRKRAGEVVTIDVTRADSVMALDITLGEQ